MVSTLLANRAASRSKQSVEPAMARQVDRDSQIEPARASQVDRGSQIEPARSPRSIGAARSRPVGQASSTQLQAGQDRKPRWVISLLIYIYIYIYIDINIYKNKNKTKNKNINIYIYK